MAHSVYELADLPVIVFEVEEANNASPELGTAVSEVMNLLERGEGPVYHIVDMSKAPQPSIDELVEGANAVTSGPNPVHHHPRVRKVIYVTKNDTLKLALKGMDSEAFGNLRALVVDTREEALALIRQAMADST